MTNYHEELKSRIADERAAIELIKITSDLSFEKSIELIIFRNQLIDKRSSEILNLHEYAKNFVKKPSTQIEKTSISIDEHQYDLPEDLDPLSFISNEQLKSGLDSFISSMPEKLKTAFILREYEGKSYEEIAIVTNCPVGTVRSRIFRAREEIVNYFKEEMYERD